MEKICKVNFLYEDGDNSAPAELLPIFSGEFMSFHTEIAGEYGVLYAGLGKHEKLDRHALKCLIGKTAKKLKELKIEKAMLEIGHIIDKFEKKIIFHIVEAAISATYTFTDFKSKNENKPIEFSFFTEDTPLDGENREIMERALNVANSVNFTRDLVNTPANVLTPDEMAKRVKAAFEGTNAEVEIFDEKQCREMEMNTFLAVGESSDYKPRLVVVRHKGDPSSSEILGLIGKGLTYDTGGYSLKQSMLGMKGDMAGAAAVAGAMLGIVKNNIPKNVTAVLVCCENRLSNSAILPGDVIKSMNGKTIEITNTDAEGRLVLADALTYAVRNEKVTRMADIATLTGSMASTLGKHRSGVFGNDKAFVKEFKKAGKKANEGWWHFPTDDIYRKMIKSEVADMRNSGDRIAGAIFAACFLEEFVENTPWLHLDIAGSSFGDAPIFDYLPKGATGFGALTLYSLAAGGCK